MKIYFAGTTGTEVREKILQKMIKRRLLSYFYMDKGLAVSYGYDLIKKSKTECDAKTKTVELFMDSGAFSAFTKDTEVNLKEYIDFLKGNKHIIDIYANLDVIGENGGAADENSAKKTLQNQRRMEKAGLSPLPVFHYGEPYKYLEYYIEKYKYIALGGLVGANTGKLVSWLDVCFSKYICGPDGLPKIKIHAFGVTSLRLMLRYPWYSVDSTSWVMMGRNGMIMVPIYRDSHYIYDENSWKLGVSNRSSDLSKKGQHIQNISKRKKEMALHYIHQKGYKLGNSEFKTVDEKYKPQDNERWADKKLIGAKKRLLEIVLEPGLSNKYTLRDELNIIYFNDLEAQWKKWPWSFPRVTNNCKLF